MTSLDIVANLSLLLMFLQGSMLTRVAISRRLCSVQSLAQKLFEKQHKSNYPQ